MIITDEMGNEVLLPIEDRGYEDVYNFDLCINGRNVDSISLNSIPSIGQFITAASLKTDRVYRIEKVEKIRLHLREFHKSNTINTYWRGDTT